MRLTKVAASAALSAALVIPGTASAGTSWIPPIGTGADPCAQVVNQYRSSIAAARTARKEAFASARMRYRTESARTRYDRKQRREARRSARSLFQQTASQARTQRSAGISSCR